MSKKSNKPKIEQAKKVDIHIRLDSEAANYFAKAAEAQIRSLPSYCKCILENLYKEEMGHF
jgi:hypothetical protein